MRLVRVQHADTGHQYTVGHRQAETDPKLRILDRPATNLSGTPLPPKYRTTLPHNPDPGASEPDPSGDEPATGEDDPTEENT